MFRSSKGGYYPMEQQTVSRNKEETIYQLCFPSSLWNIYWAFFYLLAILHHWRQNVSINMTKAPGQLIKWKWQTISTSMSRSFYTQLQIMASISADGFIFIDKCYKHDKSYNQETRLTLVTYRFPGFPIRKCDWDVACWLERSNDIILQEGCPVISKTSNHGHMV